MNVLSCFDGASCGQLALQKLGIPVSNYYASEIDKYAIQVTQANFPNTIQLGDITIVDTSQLPKIDLMMGGSPCQGFSFAGKQLNFDDPRSKLFFEFVRLLKECKPKYFLLENVKMKKEYQDVISEHLGVEPIMINSSLVSAQNRMRLYWTNIPNVKQPKDKGIKLIDIFEPVVDEKYFLSNAKIDRVLNSQRGKGYFYNKDTHDKIGTLIAGYHKEPTDGCYLSIEKVYKEPYYVRYEKEEGCIGFIGKQPKQATRVYSTNNKSQCITALGGGQGGKTGLYEIPNTNTCRKLTPTECEKLQTMPIGYTEGVSNTQRYKMIGNGWTVDVIAHILKGIQHG
jgi:DNA (cytosine-5)-methyltransferase 3A